jgi:hypothetical protein
MLYQRLLYRILISSEHSRNPSSILGTTYFCSPLSVPLILLLSYPTHVFLSQLQRAPANDELTIHSTQIAGPQGRHFRSGFPPFPAAFPPSAALVCLPAPGSMQDRMTGSRQHRGAASP